VGTLTAGGRLRQSWNNLSGFGQPEGSRNSLADWYICARAMAAFSELALVKSRRGDPKSGATF
jgi:hypothetical protein